MKSGSSSIGRELLWLVLFLALLAVFEFIMLRFVVPTGFNDRVAVMIAAIAAGIVWIVFRGRSMRPKK